MGTKRSNPDFFAKFLGSGLGGVTPVSQMGGQVLTSVGNDYGASAFGALDRNVRSRRDGAFSPPIGLLAGDGTTAKGAAAAVSNSLSTRRDEGVGSTDNVTHMVLPIFPDDRERHQPIGMPVFSYEHEQELRTRTALVDVPLLNFLLRQAMVLDPKNRAISQTIMGRSLVKNHPLLKKRNPGAIPYAFAGIAAMDKERVQKGRSTSEYICVSQTVTVYSSEPAPVLNYWGEVSPGEELYYGFSPVDARDMPIVSYKDGSNMVGRAPENPVQLRFFTASETAKDWMWTLLEDSERNALNARAIRSPKFPPLKHHYARTFDLKYYDGDDVKKHGDLEELGDAAYILHESRAGSYLGKVIHSNSAHCLPPSYETTREKALFSRQHANELETIGVAIRH